MGAGARDRPLHRYNRIRPTLGALLILALSYGRLSTSLGRLHRVLSPVRFVPPKHFLAEVERAVTSPPPKPAITRRREADSIVAALTNQAWGWQAQGNSSFGRRTRAFRRQETLGIPDSRAADRCITKDMPESLGLGEEDILEFAGLDILEFAGLDMLEYAGLDISVACRIGYISSLPDWIY
ncbi:unnamed protein product [Diplocarpon coronariae]